VTQRITTGDREAVGIAKGLEDVEFAADLIQRLVLGFVGAVSPVTCQVALGRRFQPGNGVVRQAPRQAVECSVIEAVTH
jgi:hypothetical protein